MENNSQPKYNFYLKGINGIGVLLIHGITGTPSELRSYAKSLNKAGYTVYCNTLPRHCSTLAELKKVTWQEIVDSSIADFKSLKKDCKKAFVGGLSMGALVAIHIASKFPSEVSGIIALAPTLFYDGWAVKSGWVRLMHLTWHIPFIRNAINIREDWPYGLKDEELRWSIERFYKHADAQKFSNKVFLFGSPFFPMACLYQHHQISKLVKKELSSIKTSILILHAREDDMTSIRNAQYIFDRIGSTDKTFIALENSYHMITIDNDKEKVVEETVRFLSRTS
jgi:carboxylesterase